MHAPRTFPLPWKASEIPGGFRVQDRTGRALAYVYFHRESTGRDDELLTYFEAQSLAERIAGLSGEHHPLPSGEA
jgi:hypothetical protein